MYVTSLGAGQNLFQILEILVTEMYVTSLGAGQNQFEVCRAEPNNSQVSKCVALNQTTAG